jgi:hypothetical protein
MVLILFHSREILTILNNLIDILKAALSKSVSLLTRILTSLERGMGLYLLNSRLLEKAPQSHGTSCRHSSIAYKVIPRHVTADSLLRVQNFFVQSGKVYQTVVPRRPRRLISQVATAASQDLV